MHELALAQEIISLVSEHSAGRRVLRVVLEVGKLAAVLPDAIAFCFDLCAEGTVLEGATLTVLEIPGRARCQTCGSEVCLERPFGRCDCGCTDLDWISGEEFNLKEIEVSDV